MCAVTENAFKDVDVLGAGIVNIEVKEHLAGVHLDLQDAGAARSFRRM
jgi:hypothetical protein